MKTFQFSGILVIPSFGIGPEDGLYVSLQLDHVEGAESLIKEAMSLAEATPRVTVTLEAPDVVVGKDAQEITGGLPIALRKMALAAEG